MKSWFNVSELEIIAPDEEREQKFDDKKTDIQRIFTKYKYKGNDTNLHRKINAKIWQQMFTRYATCVHKWFSLFKQGVNSVDAEN